MLEHSLTMTSLVAMIVVIGGVAPVVPMWQVSTVRFLSTHNLDHLEMRANSETDDPRVQAAYLKVSQICLSSCKV